MSTRELHRVQFSILYTLRHKTSARYSELQHPTGLESDAFKFHLRVLIQQKYVYKLESGDYALTSVGKEFANNLSKIDRTVQKQPKLSIAIIAIRENAGAMEFLLQQRLRTPFYGFWGCLSGPAQWGESFEETAKREFEKQTGLTASFAVKCFYRKTDYAVGTGSLLEDKLFVVVEATGVCGDITNGWQKGSNAWMTLSDLRSKEKYFVSTCNLIDMLVSGETYQAETADYMLSDY